MNIPEYILSVIKENKFKRNDFIGKTKFFYGSDSEDMWEKKVRENRKKYYINNPIEYKFNNYGYRTYDDFEKGKRGILTLGCSFTEGIGLHLENTWSYKIAKHFNKPLYNLAVGGTGIRDSFERLIAFGDYLKYDYVFLFLPPIGRVSMYIGDNEIIKSNYSNYLIENDFIDFFPKMVRKENDLFKWQTILFNGSDYEQYFYQFTYLNLIKYYLQSRGKHLFYIEWNEFCELYNNKNKDDIKCKDIEARDGHWGTKKQHYIYEIFKKKYEEFNSNRTS